MAYHSLADVVGYGGAGGGGKTDLGLGKANTQHRRSRIFRRFYSDLDQIIERGDAIQAGRCRFVYGEKRRWDTPDGRIIRLSAIEYEKDLKKFQGRPSDFIFIDEATQFTEHMFRYLTGWLRTEVPDQRTQALLTFNPPQDETGEWVIQFFAPWLDRHHPHPARPGELRWYIRSAEDKDVEVPSGEPVVIDDKTYTPKSRTFIHARVEDNPYYMATGYAEQLESLPEPLRSQLRYGDFNVRTSDHRWQVIPTEWVLAAEERWRSGKCPDVTMVAAGVDVARGGADNTVIAPLYGTWFDEPLVYPGAQTPDGATVALLVAQAVPSADTTVAVDVIGYGASAYDHLVAMPNVRAMAVNNAAAAPDGSTDKTGRFPFLNLRAYSYWMLREALDPASGQDVALPPVRRVRVDLCAPRYKMSGGKIAIESKEDIIKRTGFSPDYGDAIVMAWLGSIMGGPLILFEIG